MKKRLVRALIEEIIASVVAEQSIQLTIHWKGDKHSILYVRKSRIGEHRHTTQREVVEVVRELARTLPDAQIARVLGCALCHWIAVTYKDDRLGFRDVVAPSQFVDLLGRDLGIASEVELLECLHARQVGFADAPFDQSLFALLEFGLEQGFEIAEVGAPLAHRLFGQLGALSCDARHPQHLALLADGGRFEGNALRIRGVTTWPSRLS